MPATPGRGCTRRCGGSASVWCSAACSRSGTCGGGVVAGPDELAGFSEYVAARQRALLRTAYLLTGHRQDAEDLVQVTLVKVVPHWARLHGDPDAYVRTV